MSTETGAASEFDLEVLRRTQILRGFSREDCEALMAAGCMRRLERDEVVFEDSSAGDEIFIVLEGEVTVMLDPAKLGTIERASIDSHAIRRIGPAESFGELAAVTGELRTAGCVASRPDTRLLVLSAETLHQEPRLNLVLNIARDIAGQVRTSNERFLSMIVSSYFLTALVEELATGSHECSPVIPLQKLVVIRHAESFILSGADRLLTELPDKEAIEFAFFSEPETLRAVAGPGSPSGSVIFKALWAVISSGALSERITGMVPPCRFETAPDRRAGWLAIEKEIGKSRRTFHFEWQIKGALYCAETRTGQAGLFLDIYEHKALSRAAQARQMVAGIAMPIQRKIRENLTSRTAEFSGVRIVVIHHRSHEVAHTLDSLWLLGFQIDSFIGIPYGDVSWEYATMLDEVSRHCYLSLKLVRDPIEPPRYCFDFRQSSLLPLETERELQLLYQNPAVSVDYKAAMQALVENRLVQALNRCRLGGERLLVYEDGGYIAAGIYGLYEDATNPLHPTIKKAVDDGTIIGVVEVTVAGERKNLQAIAHNQGKPLLPVLSNARSEIKSVCEAMGVGEAVLNASATALGRLGLPTFQARRIACIGGNGAIGARLVEQLAALHNSTANVFVVDPTPIAFRRELDVAMIPYAATRFRHRNLSRHLVAGDCLPVSLRPAGDRRAAVAKNVRDFLNGENRYRELALANGHPLSDEVLNELWPEVTTLTEFRLTRSTPLEDGLGVCYELQRGNSIKLVSLLVESAVFSFDSVARLLRSGIDTIVGSTGFDILGPRELDAFFARPSPLARVDELVLISASSKDNEFHSAVGFLNDAITLLSGSAADPADTQLLWFETLYKNEASFLSDDDFPALKKLLGEPITIETLTTFAREYPQIAGSAGLLTAEGEHWHARLRDFLVEKLRTRVSIRKEIRSDIGSIYHLTVNGQPKRVILLADGFVINFFARHEKGVKTEYIDPVITMQLLGLVRLLSTPVAPGVHKIDSFLRPEDIELLWAAINENCRPLEIID